MFQGRREEGLIAPAPPTQKTAAKKCRLLILVVLDWLAVTLLQRTKQSTD